MKRLASILILILLCVSCTQGKTTGKKKSKTAQKTSQAVQNGSQTGQKSYTKVGKITVFYSKGDYDFAIGSIFDGESTPVEDGRTIHCNAGDVIITTVDGTEGYVSENKSNYYYLGMMSDAESCFCIKMPKNKVEAKTYDMCQFPVSDVGEKSVFESKDGHVAKIFLANKNGHVFKTYSGKKINYPNHFYVISFYRKFLGDEEFIQVEDILESKSGHFNFYEKSCSMQGLSNYKKSSKYDSPYDGELTTSDYYGNFRENGESLYDDNGNLLYDMENYEGDKPTWIDVAFIPSINALYIGGIMYYRKTTVTSGTNCRRASNIDRRTNKTSLSDL